MSIAMSTCLFCDLEKKLGVILLTVCAFGPAFIVIWMVAIFSCLFVFTMLSIPRFLLDGLSLPIPLALFVYELAGIALEPSLAIACVVASVIPIHAVLIRVCPSVHEFMRKRE